MVKVYRLFIGSKPVGRNVYKSKNDALKEKAEWNKQVKDYNKFIKEKGIDRKKQKLVTSVKEVSFSRKGNIFS